jgi:GNAT superfamily N-acetyltransferase
MSEIRPMGREDIPEVAELYRSVDNTDWRIPAAEVPAWLRRTLFDHPWFDPEIPSLVYLDDSGEIMGFIGSHTRRMRFDGEAVRVAVTGPLVAHPRVRGRGVGALLCRRHFAGAQDLTTTDSASEEMRQIYELIGGQLMHPSSIVWARVLHPWSYIGNRVLHANVHVRHRVKPWARKPLPLLDSPTARAIRYFRTPQPTDSTDEPLTPELMLEHLPQLTRSLRLTPDYDLPFLRWLFAELPQSRTWGTPQARLVRDNDGRVLGWYVYYLLPAEACHVMQIAARDRQAGAVLESLFAHAARHGGGAVQGRVEAHVLAALANRGAVFRFSPRSLVHSANGELLGALTSGGALLTQLDGQWWMTT